MKAKLRFAVLAAGISLLSACVTPTNSSMLVFPEPLAKQQLMSLKSIAVKDAREDKSLATINGEKTPANPNLERDLTTWLKESITTNTRGRKHLDINILSFSSYVMQGTMQFEAESVLQWQVEVTDLKNGASWQKSYQRSLKQDGALNLSKVEIEGHLNKLAQKLLQDTLADQEFRAALAKR